MARARRRTLAEIARTVDGVLEHSCLDCLAWFPRTAQHWAADGSTRDGLGCRCIACNRANAAAYAAHKAETRAAYYAKRGPGARGVIEGPRHDDELPADEQRVVVIGRIPLELVPQRPTLADLVGALEADGVNWKPDRYNGRAEARMSGTSGAWARDNEGEAA